MPVPDNLNDSEHLQDCIRRYLNPEVREWFSDLGDDNWNPDISTSRGSLRYACTHKDDDSLLITNLRFMLYESLVRSRQQSLLAGAFSESSLSDLKPSIYLTHKPKVELYFLEDLADVERGYSPVDGVIGLRLMDFSGDSITPMAAQSIAQRIKLKFASGGGFVWRKGKEMCSYTDTSKGYKLQLLCRSESEGRRLVEAVLDINNHSPDWSNFNHSANSDPTTAFPTVPRTERIYGERRRLPRRRPIADVRFQVARMMVLGVPNPIVLTDRTGLYSNALVR